ncbi:MULTISPECIES: pyruvate, phosphate dikinase [Streptococcus]|uniref:pyruvate, phosphate dikinase n=1 Tax=Streptococcus TaxID=1301 RepID=UPI0001FBC2C8|nr:MULTISPECIES: pyruvate, phosphate dikinase [Streptococcus]PLA64772.1 pyruvate, phosphate dikinase [Streptococcus salivarius]EGC27579.1 pyruvate, phosphate dikinase [Streptococcus sanguinis SK678]MCY7014945.1 pyruvate, phosphate dikinase [Streptococcus sanguinis]RSI03019.1 Pyruvate, phosphate dikinase [Streptococcus sanguinis]RSI28063.1 Pyruvate, phosphate dikinase [Streptococcus sanguinis]
MAKWIYSFEEGCADDKALLGGKGANLAEMTNLGLPVPPGFTITTESCIEYLESPYFFESSLKEDVLKAVTELEEKTGKYFSGNDSALLLVSVRSGAKFSMPGMMDTILNLGLNDLRTQTLAEQTNADFAYNCYRRLLQMFADVVYGISKDEFDDLLGYFERNAGKQAKDFTLEEHQALIDQYKQLYREHHQTFPQSSKEQLYAAIKAVFKSWNNPRAQVYRNLNDIPHDLGTAVNVQAMVFGNSDQASGTGVVFTRNPASGEHQLFGEFLLNAQGEDVVAGIRTPEPIAALETALPKAYAAFQDYAKILENHYKDMQDIEFTIEKGKLYILQTRNGKRTAKASLKIALDLVDEGIISKKEALQRVSPATISQLIHPVFEEKALQDAPFLAQGLPASPGAATGEIVFTAERAKDYHSLGKKVILVRQETSPEDIEGMVVSQAIVTSQGGMTSHAAVVARGMGTCCVAGCSELTISEDSKTVSCGNLVLTEGDVISVDGSSGRIYSGEIPTVLVENDQELQRLLSWADEVAQLKVRANAETVQDLKTAIKFGAKGIGLARTEHMFFGQERILEMRRLILADNELETRSALKKLLEFQEEDFYQMFKAVQDKPMIIRLLDPPMHEFLPKDSQEIKALADKLHKSPEKLTRHIEQLQESNPMLGHRGCRLGITQPEIYKMQVEALFKSAIKLSQEGLTVKPEIMIPLIADKAELDSVKAVLNQHINKFFRHQGLEPFPYEIGTMIELPRACLVADQLAQEADFFSFGTNDLTQMTYGFSRDDIGKFIGHYKEKEILPFDPFQTVDQDGVGELMRIAIRKGRQVKPELPIGICGEVGGDPASIPFFQEIGVTYVSCSPYRVPAARLAVAQAALQDEKA